MNLSKELTSTSNPMKRISLTRSMLLLASGCALGSGSSPACAVDSALQEAAITKPAKAFVEAFQKGDAKAASLRVYLADFRKNTLTTIIQS